MISPVPFREPSPAAGMQWPLIDRKFRIPDNDYARSFGYWRGNASSSVSPVEAARKFVRSEMQMKMIQKRMEMQNDKARGKEPLGWEESSANPIKLACGEPVAQDILPFTGERGMRSLAGLPTHRCRPPAFQEPAETRGLTALSNLSQNGAPGTEPAEQAEVHARKQKRGPGPTCRRVQRSGIVQSHSLKPRSFSEAEKLWKAPEFSDGMVQARVYASARLVLDVDGTLACLLPRLATSEQEFDRLTVRQLLTRSAELGETGRRRSRLPSRAQLRSSTSCAARSTPAWAKAPRKNTMILGSPSRLNSTCIIQPQPELSVELESVKGADGWMANVPNLGRVTDHFCVELASRPLYCFNLEQARYGREPHMHS